MIKYSEFQPTQLDNKGAFLGEQQNWLVLPCTQNRDSECLSRSNFEVAIEMLGSEENEEMEVHRFGHWANGWIEIIIIKPDTNTHKIALEIEASLDNYSVLDDEHFSNLEYTEANKYWESMSLSERIFEINRSYLPVSIFAARYDHLPFNMNASDLLAP